MSVSRNGSTVDELLIKMLVAYWLVSRDHWRITNWILDRMAGIKR